MIKFTGRKAKILGTSKYIPEKIMTNKDFEKIVDTNDQWIVERTGISKRHFAVTLRTRPRYLPLRMRG